MFNKSCQPYCRVIKHGSVSGLEEGNESQPWGVLVLLKLQVNSQNLGVQAPQNFEFE